MNSYEDISCLIHLHAERTLMPFETTLEYLRQQFTDVTHSLEESVAFCYGSHRSGGRSRASQLVLFASVIKHIV